MDAELFAEIVENQIRLSKDVLVDKARQYAGDEDRLHNFRVAAVLQDVTMMEALGGMMAKHTISIYDMINSEDIFTLDQWNEKITDHINYLLLLAAVIRDEEESEYVLEDQDHGGYVLDEMTDMEPEPVIPIEVGVVWSNFNKALSDVLNGNIPITMDKKRK